jgi:hypothetical protein
MVYPESGTLHTEQESLPKYQKERYFQPYNPGSLRRLKFSAQISRIDYTS